MEYDIQNIKIPNKMYLIYYKWKENEFIQYVIYSLIYISLLFSIALKNCEFGSGFLNRFTYKIVEFFLVVFW